MGFSFDAGRISLDLLATLSNRRDERLAGPSDLGEWLVAGGLAEPSCHVNAGDLERVRALRAAVFAVVEADLRGERPEAADLETVNAAAAVPAGAPRLVAAGGGLVRQRAEPDVTEILGSVARDAIDLLGGPQRALLRECAADDCSGIYVDSSPARTRRWCSAARCGNRARVAAHRARRERHRS
jgi:predicted RNA-binding Zn ribbon-like protein